MTYAEYLQTDHWKRMRAKILRRDEYRCRLCNSQESIEVHHRSYVRLWCEDQIDLITLCDSCHEKFHLDPIPETVDVSNADEFWPVVLMSDGVLYQGADMHEVEKCSHG